MNKVPNYSPAAPAEMREIAIRAMIEAHLQQTGEVITRNQAIAKLNNGKVKKNRKASRKGSRKGSRKASRKNRRSTRRN